MVRIAGLQKMTLIDYPGKLAAVVFLAGCNFHCGFCHNLELVELKPSMNFISESEFFNFLKARQGLLEGVCVGGGEPLIYPELPDFLKKIKDLGYLVKLDTNGAEFLRLKKILDLKLLDYIAMDIKASLKVYDKVTKVKANITNIKKSIKAIMKSGIDYEFRTTVLPKFHNQEEIEKIGKMIKGAKKYFLQNFRNYKTLDPSFEKEKPFTAKDLEDLKRIAGKYVKICEIRD